MKRIFSILIFIFASMKVYASIYVVHDIEESSVRSLTFLLSKMLPSQMPLTPVRQSLFVNNTSVMKDDDMVVTIGADNFKQVCAAVSTGAVLAVFIGKEEYLKIEPECNVPNSAVFSGAPLERRLALLEGIWFDRKPLAVLYSDSLQVDEVAMMDLAARYGFEFRFIKTEANRLEVLKSVNYVLEDSMVIFSLVDTELYKDGIAQDVLKLLFHKQRIMVGPSFAFVRAGALFAIYSDTEAKLKRLAESITKWQSHGTLVEADYPEQLRVSFNPYLIKSHGVVLPSASYIKDQYDLCSDSQC